MNLQQKLEARLNASKFRLLNQNMSKPSLKLTKTDITHYHSGYEKQVTKWPTNPLDIIIDQLKNETNKKIADLGCGQAKLSEVVTGVYSYDKYPVNKQITQADISQIPVADSFFDIAVCCLSFMKNNIASYIKECNRILKIGGVLYIAELTSRIGDLNKYKDGIKAMGFVCVSVDKSSKYFVILKFEKKEVCKKEVKIELKSYKYKKR